MNRVGFLILGLVWCSEAALADEYLELTPAQKKAVLETEARIRQLKAAGKLPDKVPGEDAAPAAALAAPLAGAGAAPVQDSCGRLKTGDAAIVSNAQDGSPTGLPMKYGLSRPKDDTYLMEVNLKFSAGHSYDGALSPIDLNSSFQSKVAACLKDYEGSFKNEKSGKLLVIRLTENISVPVQNISVVKAGVRPTVTEFPSDIACPTIIHEIMHVAGLPDEARGGAGAGCKPSGPANSVMSEQYDTAGGPPAPPGYSVEMCRCDAAGAGCWSLAEKSDHKKCPPGTTSFLKDIGPDVTSSLNVLNTSEAFVLNEVKVPSSAAPKREAFSLYPAHFRAITEPNCTDVNKVYYDCAVSSKINAQPGCPAKPDACKAGSLKWLE